MTARATEWAAAATGAVLVHAAMLALLVATMRPDPVEQQQMPASRLDVQALRLERSQAPERRPRVRAAAAAKAEPNAVSAGAVPQSRIAEVQASMAAPLRNTDATAQVLPPAPAGSPQAAVAKIAAAQLPARTGTGQPLIRVRPELASATPGRPRADIVPPRVPATAPVSSVPPQPAARMEPSRPASVPVPSAPSDPAPARAAAQAPERLTAALAFAGAEDGDVDPVSLAAFQSFMRPADADRTGSQLRDGVSALLAQVPCSRLQVQFDPDSATLQVNGHIPQDGLRAPVLAALQARMGSDIRVSDRMLILPRPQCNALGGIADIGLPQSTDQITNPLLIGTDTHARVLDFVRDDRLFFDLTAPDYDAFVYVDYFDAGGNVLHLAPNDRVPLQKVGADRAFRVGARGPGEAGLQILIGPPYGQEIAVAFAASVPLYDGLRPLVEPAAAYLDWLRGRVSETRARTPDFKGEWVYFFVTTAER